MKKILAIALVMIVLLNTMGYYGVFLGLHYQNDLAMSRALESGDYDESEMITIKVAVSLPYVFDQEAFERVSGKFEHNGVFYRLVKQRYAKDTLTVVCLRDTEHKELDLALSDYVKTFTDQSTDSQSQSKISISFLKDYLPVSIAIRSSTEGWASLVPLHSEGPNFIPTFSPSIVHPPERG